MFRKDFNGNIVAFQMGDLIIEESPHTKGVLHIIGKLNQDSVAKYR